MRHVSLLANLWSRLVVGLLVINLIPTPPLYATPTDLHLLETLQAQTSAELRLTYHPGTGRVRFIGTTPEQPIAIASSQEVQNAATAPAYAFLEAYGLLFGLQNPRQELTITAEKTLTDGRSFTRFQQIYQGIPVLGGELIVQAKGQAGVISASGEVAPDLNVDITPKVTAEVARLTALSQVAKHQDIVVALLTASDPELWIYDPALLTEPERNVGQLVWRMNVTDPAVLKVNELVLVDAHTGKVVLAVSQMTAARQRLVYDHDNDSTLGLPGASLMRSEGTPPTGNRDVDFAYDHLGDAYDYLLRTHGWDSIDNAGMPLIATVRACPREPCPSANAYWNGKQVVLGEGYAAADDVVAHEIAHGWIEHTANLFYFYESGAINESLADLWGEFIDQTNGRGNDTPGALWLLGEDIATGPVRNMLDPTQFKHPDRMGSFHYSCSATDNGGVHTNSGVNNKAVALLTDGGFFNGLQVAALGMPKVAKLYFEVQTNLLASGSNYNDLADALIQAGINLGFNPTEQQSLQNALNAVEMHRRPCGRPVDPPLCPTGQSPAWLFQDDMENLQSGKWAAAALQGSNGWYHPPMPNPYQVNIANAASGIYSLWGDNQAALSDSYMAMTQDIPLPAQAWLTFQHSWDFESGFIFDYDGGVVEYSVDDGATWQDAGHLFTVGRYNGSITSLGSNPLDGKRAFVDTSQGYRTSKLDLRLLAGQSVRFRFRLGTDKSFGDWGWFIDDVNLYACAAGNTRPLMERLPQKTLQRNQPAMRLIDLWEYTVDTQDIDAALTYSITTLSGVNSSAVAQLETNRYLDVIPITDQVGQTSFEIQVRDTGGLTNTATLTVDVIDDQRLYLPVVASPSVPLLPKVLFAVEDTMINLSNAGENYCRNQLMRAGNRYRTLTKFNVSRIPKGTPIQQAILRLYLDASYDIPGTVRTLAIYRIPTRWTSCAVTWKNQPKVAEESARLAIPHTSDEWYEVDVTNLVRGWVEDTIPNAGIMLYEVGEPDVDPAFREFASLNSGVGPVITLTYAGATGTDVANSEIAAEERDPIDPADTPAPLPLLPLCREVADPAQMCLSASQE